MVLGLELNFNGLSSKDSDDVVIMNVAWGENQYPISFFREIADNNVGHRKNRI